MAYTLDFNTRSDGGAGLDKIAQVIAEIGKRTTATSGELKILESVLQSDAKSGIALDSTLKAIARSTESFTAGTRAAVKEVIQLGLVSDKAAESTLRAATADRARTASIDQQRIAIEKAAAAEELRNRRQGVAAARAALNFASAAGVGLGGAAGQALSGTSALITAGVGGATLALGGTALALAAVSAAAIKAANSLGEYAHEQKNLSERTGLSTQDTQLYTRAAELAGVNAGALTTSMRTLSKALSENSEDGKKAKQSLSELGISGADSLKPIGDIIPLIFAKLAAIPDGAEKDRIAISLFGRSALELLPLIDNFDKLGAAVRASGVIIDKDGIEKADLYRSRVKELGLEWDSVVNKFKRAAVGTVSIALDFGSKYGGKVVDLATGVPSEDIANLSRLAGLALEGSDLARQRAKQAIPLPSAPKAPSAPDPLALRAEQRQSQIEGIRQEFQTPKERIDSRIKSLREQQALAEQSFVGARSGPEADAARSKVETISRNIAAAERERDALKDNTRTQNELIRLQEKLAQLKEKELFGEARINAEYAAEVENLGRKKEKNDATVGTLDKIRQEQLKQLQTARDIAAIESNRKDQDTGLSIQQQEIRRAAASKGRLAQADLDAEGPTAAGIDARAKSRVESAKLELDLAKQRLEVDRQRITEETQRGADPAKTGERLKQVAREEAKAAAQAASEIANAEDERRIQRDALRRQEARKAEEADRSIANIQLNAQKDDIVRQFSKAQTLTELQLGGGTKAGDVEETYTRRLQLSAKLFDLEIQRAAKEKDADKRRVDEAEAYYTLIKERQEAQLDRELKIAEARKKQQEQFVSGVQGGFSALLRGGPAGLGQFVRGQAEGLATTVVGNAARNFYASQNLEGRFQLPGTVDSSGKPTRLGGLLAGTLLGPQVTEKDATKAVLASQVALKDSNLLLKGSVDYLASAITGQQVPGSSAGQAPAPAAGNLPGIIGGLFGISPTAQQSTAAVASAVARPSSAPAGALGDFFSAAGVTGSQAASTSAGIGAATAAIAALARASAPGGFNTVSPLGSLASAIGPGGTSGFVGPVSSIISTSARIGARLSASSGGSAVPFGADPGSGEGGNADGFSLKSFSKGGIKSNAIDVLFGRHADPGSGEGGVSTGQQVAAIAQLAGAGYAAFRGISEITKGGAKNVIGGIAQTAGAIAPFTGPAAPFIEAGALAVGLISSLLPDPRKQRQDQINSELQRNVFQAPVSQSRTQNIDGSYTDFNKFGQVRTSDLSAVPITTAPYTTKRNGVWYDIPGSTLSPFSQNGGGQISSAPPMQVTVNLTSMDAKSGIDYFRNNPGVAHAAIHAGLTQANGPAQKAVRSVVGLQ